MAKNAKWAYQVCVEIFKEAFLRVKKFIKISFFCILILFSEEKNLTESPINFFQTLDISPVYIL